MCAAQHLACTTPVAIGRQIDVSSSKFTLCKLLCSDQFEVALPLSIVLDLALRVGLFVFLVMLKRLIFPWGMRAGVYPVFGVYYWVCAYESKLSS
jgi:hypothetical protein